MKTEVSIPDLGLLAMTRGLLGAGLGLLIAGKLSDQQRRPLGWTLFAIGLVTTVPLAIAVLGGARIERVRSTPRLRAGKRLAESAAPRQPTRH